MRCNAVQWSTQHQQMVCVCWFFSLNGFTWTLATSNITLSIARDKKTHMTKKIVAKHVAFVYDSFFNLAQMNGWTVLTNVSVLIEIVQLQHQQALRPRHPESKRINAIRFSKLSVHAKRNELSRFCCLFRALWQQNSNRKNNNKREYVNTIATRNNKN